MKAMHDKPLFLFVIPTYNRSVLLKRAIDSILVQDYTNFRIYVCNDGSTDNTTSILDNYAKDERIAHLELAKNSGVNKARNTILKKIEDDRVEGYLLFLDDDDYFIKGALLVLSKVISNNPSKKWILSRCLDTDGNVLTKIKSFGQLSYISDYMCGKSVAGDACHCIRTDLVNRQRFTEEFKNAEEWYFYSNLSKKSGLFSVKLDSLVKDCQPAGLSDSGYNIEKKAEVFKLKIETLKGFVTKRQLADQQLSLARELIRLRKYQEANAIFDEIPLLKKLTLRFVRYRIKTILNR